MAGIVAHRGASGLLPENTLPAFRKALEIGVAGIEIDVQLSADGIAVVHHDLRLKPETTRDITGNWLAGAGAPICRLTIEELRTFDVGRLDRATRYARRYPDQQPVDGTRIPTFESVIDLLKQHGTIETLWIELKTDPEQPEASSDPVHLAEAVVSMLDKHDFRDRAVLISFDWRGLLHTRRLSPEMNLGFLSAERTWTSNIRRSRRHGLSPWTAGLDIRDFSGSVPQMVKAAGGDVWSVYFRDLTPEKRDEAREIGLSVNIWTLSNRRDKPAFLALETDFITTDRPDWFR